MSPTHIRIVGNPNVTDGIASDANKIARRNGIPHFPKENAGTQETVNSSEQRHRIVSNSGTDGQISPTISKRHFIVFVDRIDVIVVIIHVGMQRIVR